MECSEVGCSTPSLARALCDMHYRRWRRRGTTELPRRLAWQERFWNQVDREGPIPAHRPELGNCWVWTGATQRYGVITIDRQSRKTHRISYEMHLGAIPDGMLVCHHCDNPPCVRPDHLFLGTEADNNHDRDRKGRTARNFGLANGSRKHPERLVRGDKHPLAKLTAPDVIEIRSSTDSQSTLAKRFGVSQSVVANIRARRRWAHVD